jgi:hypothetical protein
MKPEIVG